MGNELRCVGYRWRQLQARLKAENMQICAYCKKRIDLSLPWNHNWAWSADHIIPKTVAPELRYEFENLQEAHRICNILRVASGPPDGWVLPGREAPDRRVNVTRQW